MRSRLRLSCALLGHKARREPVWNDGFYFAACSRCDQDIVRIPGGKWHTPRNAHVVWSVVAPPSVLEARLKVHRQGPLQAFSELPEHTRISGTAARELRQGAQSRTTAAEQRRSSIPDFMDDPECPIEVAPGPRPAGLPEGPRPVPAPSVRVA